MLSTLRPLRSFALSCASSLPFVQPALMPGVCSERGLGLGLGIGLRSCNRNLLARVSEESGLRDRRSDADYLQMCRGVRLRAFFKRLHRGFDATCPMRHARRGET